MKRVYTVKEIAEALGIGLTKAYSMVQSGEIRSVQLRKAYRIPAIELERIINANNGVMEIRFDETPTKVHRLPKRD